jgi:putative FmdB family regulatory protein
MPTYDYRCEACGGFDALRSLSERNEPIACPDCGRVSPRVMAGAPRLALLERARHEPSRSGDYARLAHPAGCGCCSPGKRGATVKGANGSKAFPSKRPWMISH